MGPVKNEGSEITQEVLTSKATIVLRRSLLPLTTVEQTLETECAKWTLFISFIKSKLRYYMIKPSKPLPTAYVPYSDGNLDAPPLHMIKDDSALPYGTSAFEKPLLTNGSMLN